MNIPNILSIFRLCLVPVFAIMYFSGLSYARPCSALIYALASFTDYLDGYIARKYDLITNLGRVLDPLGDKMFTLAVLSCLAIDRIIPFWALIVFFSKEMLMGIGGLFVHKRLHEDMPSSNFLGKASTGLFFAVCAVLLVAELPNTAVVSMISAALGVSLMAFASYLINLFRLMKREPE